MKSPENEGLNLCLQLTSSLMEEMSNIQVFRGKWSGIRSKLEGLPMQLNDLADFPRFDSNPLCSDLLRSISETLADSLSLAKNCKNYPISKGKLRMQSDIDSLSAKLDQHNKDIDLLIKSGVLQEPVLAPHALSRKEAVRIEARNLITRLQLGNSGSKSEALDSLSGLLQEDDKNVVIAVAQGAVSVLVRLLDSSSLEIKEKAVSAISRISTVASSKNVLVAEGVLLLNHLLRVLESGSGFSKEKACFVLQVMSSSVENARLIGSRGGISSLLEICLSGTPGSQAIAAGVLRNLAGITEIKSNFVEENAVPVLIALSASGTPIAQENSIGCLRNLASDDENLKLLIVNQGGIQCLESFWDRDDLSSQSQEVAVGLLSNLASYKAIAEHLVGFIPKLVGALNSGASNVRIGGARAVYELSFSTKTRKEMGKIGCMPPLIQMLDAKGIQEREAASMALSSLLSFSGNRRLFLKEEKGIAGCVQLLDPSIIGLEKEYAISVLLSLSQSKKCRKQMVNMGACVFLKKQLDMEDIEGAKKLYENLSKGKLWSILG